MAFIETVDIVVSADPHGHACIYPNGDVTIFLSQREENLLNQAEFPFHTIPDLIEELVIHELLHVLTGEREDYRIDSWHMLACRILNPERKTCDCPIDCPWRMIVEA